MSAAVRTRKTASERREAVLEAALAEFGARGLHGTSTEDIARRAGISQPYLFRLYGTKKELFLAAVAAVFQRTLETFREALGESQDLDMMKAMGQAYVDLLADRSLLLAQMQAYAACDDVEVREVVRNGFAELYRFVERVTGASADEVRTFFATGMLLNVAAAMDLPGLEEPWAGRCLGPCKQ